VTIKGSRRQEEADGGRYYRRERGFGEFARTVTLPGPIDPETVQAEYTDGVLSVRMAKAEETKPKKVEIKA